MTFRSALLASVLAVLAALPAQAEKIPLSAINAYFNGLSAAATEFTQVNADGSVSTGVIKMQRPGRMRFEYAPPDTTLVLASGGQLAIFDAKSNQPPEQYPLARTPLGLILARQVDLSRSRMVVAHVELDGTTRILAQDPEHPDYGTIELYFTDKPVQLRQWVITDDMGAQTTVILGDLKPAPSFAPSTFSITAEVDRRK